VLACALALGGGVEAVRAADDRPGTAVSPPGVPSPAELEARGATVGSIEVHVQNIFDPSDPRESAWFYRTANSLHYRTRESTVREQLLFASGQPFSAQRAAETERILRGRDYLNDAWVVPLRYDAEKNVVDVSVTVRDVWTLNPGVSVGRSGGANRTRVEIEEENLFGRGSRVSVSRARDVDRTSTIFKYSDPGLFGRWLQLDLQYLDNSDGKVKAAGLARPFYSLDTHSAWGLTGYDGTSTVSRYEHGEIYDRFQRQARQVEVYGGRSDGLAGGWTRRWYYGWRYDHENFARLPDEPLQPAVLPADRKYSYPWVAWQLIEDRYAKDRNLDLIGRTEDLYLGRSLYAELGWSSRSFGADQDALLARVNALAGFAPDDRTQVFLDGTASGRFEDGTARNVRVSARGRYFFRLDDRQLLYAALTGTTTRLLDPEAPLVLGGEEGLRAYPLRFQGGTSSALLTLEHRLYTGWFPFRLVRVGAAVFFDAGRTWGTDIAGNAPYGLLKDVGVGLRFGNVRSGLGNVLHVDLSYALDARPGTKRFEVTVETKQRF
jgi:outer membrane protein assembly factor BamA